MRINSYKEIEKLWKNSLGKEPFPERFFFDRWKRKNFLSFFLTSFIFSSSFTSFFLYFFFLLPAFSLRPGMQRGCGGPTLSCIITRRQ